MKPEQFLNHLNDDRIVAAIAEAERRTTGEIRVFVSGRRLGRDSIAQRAEARFRKLGMASTRERNAVLIYFVPRDQKFAVIGDRAIHEKCGPAFWKDVAGTLEKGLRCGSFTDAVAAAIEQTSSALARHFPVTSDQKNELPDRIERD